MKNPGRVVVVTDPESITSVALGFTLGARRAHPPGANRPWRDGGRDAEGDYLLGPRADPVAVQFALEAKC